MFRELSDCFLQRALVVVLIVSAAFTMCNASAVAANAAGVALTSFHGTSALSAKKSPARSLLHAPSGLPAPPIDRSQSLIYRAAEQPIGDHNAVAFWLLGDARPGTITVFLLASGGASNAPLTVPGCGSDDEPLWPALLSKPISTNFPGWKKVILPLTDFTYRPAVGSTQANDSTISSAVDTFGIASEKNDGVIYLNDIAWVTEDPTGNILGAESAIDDFSAGNVADWKVKGTPEAVARLVPGITSLAAFTKQSSVSLKLDYSALTANRRALESSAMTSMTSSGKDYIVSVPQSPFERILPDSLPFPKEYSSLIALTECPEQTECGSFVIYSKRGMSDVTVHMSSDLLAIGKSISRSNVKISVVKVWNRQGGATLIDPDSSGPTPELLVKDDRVALAAVAGVPPDARVTGDPVTDIPAGSEKQFWIDVTVPKNTAPGLYTCQLTVKSKEEAPFSVSLQATVLPLRLLSPSKQYVINYRGKLSDGAGSDGQTGNEVAPDLLSDELQDIADHGFHYITLSDSPGSLQQTLTAESAFNFQTPILYPVASGDDGLETAKAVAKLSTDTSNYCYLVPDSDSLASDLENLKKAGLQTAAVINSDAEYSAVQNNLDVAIYPVQEAYVQRLEKSSGKRQTSTRDWLTWPSAQANPQVDRLYAGYMLWRTDLYGAYISDYESYSGGNPYDDTIGDAVVGRAAYKPAMLTYPTQEGVVDTVQWEAIREGINDVRYLTTFYTALRECKDAKIDLIQVDKAETDVTNFLNSAYWLMSDADYQKGRIMITSYALQLRKAVDSFNAHPKGASKQSSFQTKHPRRLV